MLLSEAVQHQKAAVILQALAAAIVAFTMLYFRRLYTIDPNAVYRKALVALNTNPGALEVNVCSATLLSMREGLG